MTLPLFSRWCLRRLLNVENCRPLQPWSQHCGLGRDDMISISPGLDSRVCIGGIGSIVEAIDGNVSGAPCLWVGKYIVSRGLSTGICAVDADDAVRSR